MIVVVDHAQDLLHLNQYYSDDSRLRVSRFRDSQAETYFFARGRWEPDQELYDILIGELWLDEITEEEAMEIIARRSREHTGAREK